MEQRHLARSPRYRFIWIIYFITIPFLPLLGEAHPYKQGNEPNKPIILIIYINELLSLGGTDTFGEI